MCTNEKSLYYGGHLVFLLMKFPVTDKDFQTWKLVFNFELGGFLFLAFIYISLTAIFFFFPIKGQGWAVRSGILAV